MGHQTIHFDSLSSSMWVNMNCLYFVVHVYNYCYKCQLLTCTVTVAIRLSALQYIPF